MKPGKSRQVVWISLALAGILVTQDVLPAEAAQSPVFEQMMSGIQDQREELPESAYTRIVISSEEELAQLAQNCELDVWSRDKYVTLEKDIVLKEYKGLSIPSFGGIFDGGGFAISGLELRRDGSAVGLFRYVQTTGILRNLSVSGTVEPGGSGAQAGILVGMNYGRIENCSVSGSVTGTEDIGGIAGVNEGTGEIRRCRSEAFVTGGHSTGGICGRNHGTLNNCQNCGNINTHSTELSLDIEDITIEDLEDVNSTKHVTAHTDTGGIAGYSDGKIYYCTNSATVGYQHVGYNTGGIVGRLHQGYVQNCTNTGHILGRKDVGGIVGQMEPFLEIQYLNDKLGELDREIGIFFDLLEATHEDISSYGDQASALASSISNHLTNASTAGSALTGAASDLWYIYNQELTGINNDLSRLNGEWKSQAEGIHPTGEEHMGDGTGEQGAEEAGQQTGEDAGDTGALEGIPVGQDLIEGSTPEPGETGAGAADGSGEKTQEESTEESGIQNPTEDSDRKDIHWEDIDWTDFDKVDIDKTDIENLGKDVESYFAALRRFGEGVSGHLSNITAATSDRSGGISSNLQVLNGELEAAGKELQQLAEILQQGGHQTSADVDALVAQAKVVRGCIGGLRDDLFRYEGITVEDTSDEAAGGEMENLGAVQPEEAYYDTSVFQQGKITLCINQGPVEADTNVGGITGLIATEYDFDPEDDVTLTGEESFRIEQSVKAVVRESRNLGNITGKKDHVGGVVGKADFGAIVSCESYGFVESTGGSYVGGIAGSSDYCIRSCYTMGGICGESYVGGIVGKGCDIFYSYAYPEITCAGECAGSIAGEMQQEGILYGNYYVEGKVPGVDSIGYAGGAEPLSYEAFSSMEGVPEAFSKFTVRFFADGKELATFQCSYGGSIDKSQIPEVPEKEGFYGGWPEFDCDFVTGSCTLEAQYERWITSLASQEKDEDGKAVVLVQGEFLPENTLLVEKVQDGGTKLSIQREGTDQAGAYESQLLVRALCDNPEQTKVELWTENGYRPVSATTVGSYLEFTMEGEGTFRLTAVEEDNSTVVVAAWVGGCVAVIGISVLLFGRLTKRRKKKEIA